MEISNTPLFGLTVTVAAFFGATYLYTRIRWLHPLITTSGSIILLLVLMDIPYQEYKLGGDILALLLGPATVALAVPLYKHFEQMQKQVPIIVTGVLIGCMAGMLSAGGIVAALSGSRELMLTMIPKTVTTPIAIELVQVLGGAPELGAVLTVLTGLVGSMVGPKLLNLCGVKGDIALGVAIGTSSHGIGTARLINESQIQASVSGFAMGLAGISLSILVIPLHYIL
ncbi:LrgB family protein [Brevibacillus sp. SYSU BS000544]|uniref:LrgB family protein n=1 Tax=Brevibacillus sp. SYSU BS000544 TaxID=3416443 RepID=UPI003CE49208